MVAWMAPILLFCGLLLTGCATSKSIDGIGDFKSESIVAGFIQVEPMGPHFRMHQADALVRFFDVKEHKSGERTRVHVKEQSKSFVARLSPGQYELYRIQIGEGPFRSEAHVSMSFDVIPDKATYLGVWHLRVDSPKTVRMLQWEVLEDVLDWELLVALHPELHENEFVVSLPQPTTTQLRLFAVAPSQPRSKYFYRR